MNFNCNGIFISSRDEAAKFDIGASFDTAYGEPWFLKKEPFDCASLFPKKNKLRVMTDMKAVKNYIAAAGMNNFEVNAWLLYSKSDAPQINSSLELVLGSISKSMGYDILSLSVNYSLLYDTLVKSFASGEISFDDSDEGLSEYVGHFRERLNSHSLFDKFEDAAAFLEECSEYFRKCCEQLIIPGWEDISELCSHKGGGMVDDNLICYVKLLDMKKLIEIFKESLV